MRRIFLCAIPIVFCFLVSTHAYCQNTTIKGFVEAHAVYDKDKVSFGLGEQDLFISSELNDRLSFLGETVFKYDPSSDTKFAVSVERIVIKYNIQGNNNIIIGKVHTPLNYWNDTYHHGRVFFPTIDRPLLFGAEIIPLHTTGISLQGHDFGNLRFGYDFMVGNGIGSSPVTDNDHYKSITAAVHIKPIENMRIGVSYYNDIISKGADVEGKTINWKVNQQLFSGSFAYFGKKFEMLAEGTMGINVTDTTGTKRTLASYLYAGYKVTDKIIPYFRLDNLTYQNGEVFFTKDNTTAVVAGLRFQINYLAVVKLEYQYTHSELNGFDNRITTQFAIGF
jgi:hypothetical protein